MVERQQGGGSAGNERVGSEGCAVAVEAKPVVTVAVNGGGAAVEAMEDALERRRGEKQRRRKRGQRRKQWKRK